MSDKNLTAQLFYRYTNVHDSLNKEHVRKKLQSLVIRYLVPAWGRQEIAGGKATQKDALRNLDFLRGVSVEELMESPNRLGKYLTEKSVSKENRRKFSYELDRWLRWVKGGLLPIPQTPSGGGVRLRAPALSRRKSRISRSYEIGTAEETALFSGSEMLSRRLHQRSASARMGRFFPISEKSGQEQKNDPKRPGKIAANSGVAAPIQICRAGRPAPVKHHPHLPAQF